MDEKKPNPGAFKKGDPRINRKGRPKSFDALRELAQKISHERLKDTPVTTIEAILRGMTVSNPERFIEIAFGKVPQPIDITTAGEKINEIVIRYADNDNTTDPTPGPAAGETRTPPV
jgi:hypothetical protein